MLYVTSFLLKWIAHRWVLWEADPETEASTWKVYSGCPWGGGGIQQREKSSCDGVPGRAATGTLWAVLKTNDPLELF